MSRILSIIKGRKKFLLGIFVSICFWCVLSYVIIGILKVFVKTWLFLSALTVCCLFINCIARWQVIRQVRVFYPTSQIRNVDYLIIGDMYKPTDINLSGKKVVHIYAPRRTLIAAYEILRHTYSIIKENGTVVVALNRKNVGLNKYNIFDIPFFHPITIKKLGLLNLKKWSRLPILIAPMITFRMICGCGKGYKTCECPNKEIVDFCLERSIDLVYKIK